MTGTTNQAIDWNEHRRKIHFQHLSLRTTRDSLMDYLSGFELELCVVPFKEGRPQSHGFVIFRKKSSVDNVMSRRPHIIDGQPVEVYRSVPDQGSLKYKAAVTELIVGGLENGMITERDLKEYFRRFGQIVSIKMHSDDDSCCMEFEDYDSVDMVLLDRPHKIRNIELQLTKGSRKNPFDNGALAKSALTVWNNNASVVQKKSNMKQVQIDPEPFAVNLPKKVYCVHINNLPSNADAETLSQKFGWLLGYILMNSSNDDQSSSVECWLKGIYDRDRAEEFVKKWHEKLFSRTTIDCEVQEDRLEFCNKFRIGICSKTNEGCDWEHIRCTARGRCSSDCPYGHDEGAKTGSYNDVGTNDTYRIKITGFQKKLTPDVLAQILHEKKCFINRSDDSVGYVGTLKSMKYARRLMDQWHNKIVDGQQLRCQIEWNSRPMVTKAISRSGSRSNLFSKENDSGRFVHSRQQTNSAVNSSRDSSISRNDSNTNITTLNDQDFNYEPRLYERSVAGLVKQKETDVKNKTKSTEKLTSSAGCGSRAGSLKDISQVGRTMTLGPSKTDHGSRACLIEYNGKDEEIYRRELDALKLLKGVKGVVQLIELKGPSGINEQASFAKNKLSLITMQAPDRSLKEFVTQEPRGGFGVLEAVQLVQNLIIIVKQVHSKGILHQNLGPEGIMIDWNSKQSSIDQAQLTLINFSQAYIKADKKHSSSQPTTPPWYKAPQANVELFKHSSSIDASSICAVLLWLLTNADPRHSPNILPHQQDNVIDKLDSKIAQAVRNANASTKQPLEEIRLKTYLIDTFNVAFGYPQYQPWTIGDLECRLESIRELLSPRNPKLDTTDAIFKDLVSSYNSSAHASSTQTSVLHDVFQKAAMAFEAAKRNFASSNNNQYSWSDGGCTWVESIQTGADERRHDDILTYNYQDGYLSGKFSVIITCLATLTDEGNCITLSICSAVHGRICRIPVGRYSKTQHFAGDVQKNFTTELGNLMKSITKEQRAKPQ